MTPTGNLLHGIALRSSNGFAIPLGPAQPSRPGFPSTSSAARWPGTGNLIRFNGTGGVAIFGNPVSASGQANLGNAIEGNSIFENGRNYQTASSAPLPLLGIDLTNGFLYPRDDGLTPNDSKGHGTANAPNDFRNFPVLTTATSAGGTTNIAGTLSSLANTAFRIEFFANDTDPLGLPAEDSSSSAIPASSRTPMATWGSTCLSRFGDQRPHRDGDCHRRRWKHLGFSAGLVVPNPPNTSGVEYFHRMSVQGDNVLIAGFCHGTRPKNGGGAGIGPSLAQFLVAL